MKNLNLKKSLMMAAVAGAICAAPGLASAEININTDTGVSVDTVINAGLKPETRIIYPETGVITRATPAPVQYTYVTRPATPSVSTQTAAQIAAESGTALITVDGDEPIMTSSRSVILPEGSTLSKLGTNNRIASSTTVTNINRSPDQNRILNTFGTTDMSDTIGETNTTVSSNVTTYSLDNRPAIQPTTRVYTTNTLQPTYLMPKSEYSGSVSSSMSGSMR